MNPDDLDPDFSSLYAEARRLSPHVHGASVEITADRKTVLLLSTDGASAEAREELTGALRAHRRRHDLLVEFLIVESARHVDFESSIPGGWPPT